MDLEHFMLIFRALRSNHDPIFCPPELKDEKVLDFCNTLISILTSFSVHFVVVTLTHFLKEKHMELHWVTQLMLMYWRRGFSARGCWVFEGALAPSLTPERGPAPKRRQRGPLSEIKGLPDYVKGESCESRATVVPVLRQSNAKSESLRFAYET